MRPITISKTGAGASSPVPLDGYISPFNVTLRALVTGTVDYTIQYTSDDVYAVGYNPAVGDWTAITGMTVVAVDSEATLISPISAVRILVNSGAGSVALTVRQAGIF